MTWTEASRTSGRHRELTLILDRRRTLPDRTKPGRKFRPDRAIIRLEADTDDAPYTRFAMTADAPDHIVGAPKAVWDNTTPDPGACIRSAPSWVRALFAESTGHGHLINAYAGPGWARDIIESRYPLDARYPLPGQLETAA